MSEPGPIPCPACGRPMFPNLDYCSDECASADTTPEILPEYTPEAWRMEGYYPESYAKFMAALGIGIDYSDSDFDRYEAEFRADLAAHDAEVARKALTDAADEHLRQSIAAGVGSPSATSMWLRARAEQIGENRG